MIDLHSHILPDIDDGAKDMATSLQMLKIAVKCKTKVMFATPHVIGREWLPPWELIVDKCIQLTEAAEKQGVKLQIYPGAEVAICLDILEHISGPGPYCLNGGSYMLVELPAMEVPGFTEDFLFTLQARGIDPIIAHPERHPVLAKQPEILKEWINKGILTQINGASLTGRMGEKAKKMAELFLQNNMVYFLGSDAHSARTRNPDLTEAVEQLHRLVDEDYAQQILKSNPAAVLAGRGIDIIEVNRIKITKPRNSLLEKLVNFFN